jgi:hypothetical protein
MHSPTEIAPDRHPALWPIRVRCETVGKPHFLRASTHNSTSARWASKSSTGRNCRRCSVHGKTQDSRNSTTRHYTSSLAHSLKCCGLIPSNHKLERCCWAADDSRAGSRSHASDRCAARERARRTQWLAAATRALHLMQRMCATLVQRTRSAIQMRQVVRNFGPSPVRWDLTSRMTASLPSCSPAPFIGSWPEADIQKASIDVCVRGICGRSIREA